MPTKSPARVAALCGAALLFACKASTSDPDPDPDPGIRGEDLHAFGSYTVSGDTLIIRTPEDTAWECEGDEKIMSESTIPPQRRRFALAGDRLRIYAPPDTFPGASGAAAAVQFHILYVRDGGGQGIEGRWRSTEKAYDLLSGALDAASQAKIARILQAFRTQDSLLVDELILSGGRAWLSRTGDLSGNFVAKWNGLLTYSLEHVPDSAAYDITVSAPHPDTVRLEGRRTGEIVTVTFTGPLRAFQHFASDNPDHPAFSEDDATLTCPQDRWYSEFLSQNQRLPVDPPGGREPLVAEAFFLGDYVVSADTLFMRLPPDTTLNCFGSAPTLDIEEGDIDTNRFAIAGNQFRLYQEVDGFDTSAEDTLAMRMIAHWTRADGGPGIDGKWQADSVGYERVSGTWDAEMVADLDRSVRLSNVYFRYLTVEYEFARGKAFVRLGGDHAGYYVARWNGEVAWDPLDEPDSARYDIEVSIPAPGTVRLKGRKSGETVMLTFVGPMKEEHYASDRPGRLPYSEGDYNKRCDVVDWIYEFQEANLRDGFALEKRTSGGRQAAATPNFPPKPLKKAIFGLPQGFPLKRPHSLLN